MKFSAIAKKIANDFRGLHFAAPDTRILRVLLKLLHNDLN